MDLYGLASDAQQRCDVTPSEAACVTHDHYIALTT